MNTTMEKQVEQTFATLRRAVANTPDELWPLEATPGYLSIARLVFHILQTIDYHLDESGEEYDWGKFGVNWEASHPEELPTKPQAIELLDQAQAQASGYVADEKGLDAADLQPHFFLSRLDHLCYVLRHTTIHTGEINCLLRLNGQPVGGW